MVESGWEPATEPQEAVEAKSLSCALSNMLDTLAPRDRDIMRQHYGFDTGEPAGYREIADKHGLSHERVRQRIVLCRAILRKRFSQQRDKIG
jgi:RNA polymerase sigma factor (sigma-70 family)